MRASNDRSADAAATIALAGVDKVLLDDESPFGAYTPTRTQSALIAVAAHTPLGRGKLRRCLSRALAAIRPGPADVHRFGQALRLYHSSYLHDRKLLINPGRYELEEFAFLFGAAPADFRFLDIGANAGFYSMTVASRLPQARVLAIEPNPINLRKLRFNLRNNRFPGIEVQAIAVGAADGTARMNIHEESLLWHVPGQAAVDVVVRPLLAVLNECGFDRIDVLKIDVEGYEDRVLEPYFRDAPAALLPRRIIIEHSSGHMWHMDIIARAREIGYVERGRNRENTMLEQAAASTRPS